MLVAGTISVAYTFRLSTFYVVRCVYPIYLRHGLTTTHDTVVLRGLRRRTGSSMPTCARWSGWSGAAVRSDECHAVTLVVPTFVCARKKPPAPYGVSGFASFPGTLRNVGLTRRVVTVPASAPLGKWSLEATILNVVPGGALGRTPSSVSTVRGGAAVFLPRWAAFSGALRPGGAQTGTGRSGGRHAITRGLLDVVLGILTAILGTVLGIVAAVVWLVGGVLCVTVILLPLGLPPVVSWRAASSPSPGS